MGYKMNGFSGFGNSPVKKKGGPETKQVDVDKLIDEDFQDTEGTQYEIDPHNISYHLQEGSIKEQERLTKKAKK